MKKTYGDLVADQSGLLVETTTIGYREMLCVDIPWSEVGDDIFGSVPTAPTNAATQENEAAELKAQGDDAYQQAKEARDAAKEGYDADAVQKLIDDISAVREKLYAAVNGGELQEALQTAETTGMVDEKGTPLAEKADAADRVAKEKERAA